MAISRIKTEYRVFASCSLEMRALLIANAIYALVLPVIEIFVAAYVLRNSQQADQVLVYQLSVYAVTPVAFLLNGYLLRILAANYLYAAGMCLSGGALVFLMCTDIHTVAGILLSGGLMGMASGIFWANRGLLALSATCDHNRNYYYGIETGIITLTSVSVPLAVGGLIEKARTSYSFGDGANAAYKAIAIAALFLTAVSSMAMLLGRYKRSPTGRFLFFRFHPLWRRLLALAALKGLGQGYIVTAPALLILKLVGREGTLGVIESVGSLVGAACLYAIGRVTGPRQRPIVLAAGMSFFVAGAAMNTVLFNATGAIVFMGCLLLAKPLIDLAYYPIQLHAVDVVAQIERRSQYSYILNHEVGLFAGRFLGCALFIGISRYISDWAAIRYAVLIVGILQLPSIVVARKLTA